MNIANKLLKNKSENQTVFTSVEIKQLCQIKDKDVLYSALIYATNKGYLYRITRGIYSFDKKYSRREFANKYRSPSYISLYSVLQSYGVVFQPYPSIYAITNRSEKIEIDKQKYIYRKIKDEILLNPVGVLINNTVSTATTERSLCDKLYLDGIEYFDNLRNINWKLMEEINQNVYRGNSVILEFINKNKG